MPKFKTPFYFKILKAAESSCPGLPLFVAIAGTYTWNRGLGHHLWLRQKESLRNLRQEVGTLDHLRSPITFKSH